MKWCSKNFEIMSSKSGATTSATSGGDFSCINPGGREELVGKRFLLVSSNGKLKLSRISELNLVVLLLDSQER